jgi:hypothetical protein
VVFHKKSPESEVCDVNRMELAFHQEKQGGSEKAYGNRAIPPKALPL